MTNAAVLAVDGGNSKADLALVSADGELLAAVRGSTISHQAVGLDAGLANLAHLAHDAAAQASAGQYSGSRRDDGLIADHGVYGLAGADYPEDVRLLTRAIEARELTRSTAVLNDTFVALRAGTHRPWGIALICGQGINAAAVAPDGRTARFDGVGTYSGDWGGGGGVGEAGSAAAVRGSDGRGPRTALEKAIPRHFGLASPAALTKALYFERIDGTPALPAMAPVVFQAAGEGDAVARAIIDRLADELVGLARALVRRLQARAPRSGGRAGRGRVQDGRPAVLRPTGSRASWPLRRARRSIDSTAPPVLGAALIGLDRHSHGGATPPEIEARLRSAFEAWVAQ